MDDAGLESAAILLMSLGEEDAAEVLKHLSPKEVQRMGETIAGLKSVTREKMESVIGQFNAAATEQMAIVGDTGEYVRSVLKKALGNEKATLLLDRILHDSDVSGIESLKWMEPGAVAELLRNEHPQIVAATLVHLEQDHAAAVLKLFEQRHRNEVIVRIATLEGLQPMGLKDLNEIMAGLLSGKEQVRKSKLGGVKPTAEILNLMGSSVEQSVLDYLREVDDELAQKVMDNMFTFDDLGRLDDKGMQALLKEVQTDSLVIALKGAPAELRELVFRNMSSRASETLREELESRGPVRVAEVEAEQKEILKTVRRLTEDGSISLGGGGDDQFV